MKECEHDWISRAIDDGYDPPFAPCPYCEIARLRAALETIAEGDTIRNWDASNDANKTLHAYLSDIAREALEER